MSEKEIIILLKSINIKIEALQAQMIMFQEALQPDMEYNTRVEEEIIPESNNKPDAETKGEASIPPLTEEKKSEFWTHLGKRYKNCKYGCGNIVSWNYQNRNYDHYTTGYKFISAKCPLYAQEGK